MYCSPIIVTLLRYLNLQTTYFIADHVKLNRNYSDCENKWQQDGTGGGGCDHS